MHNCHQKLESRVTGSGDVNHDLHVCDLLTLWLPSLSLKSPFILSLQLYVECLASLLKGLSRMDR